MGFSTSAALDQFVLANATEHPYDGHWHPSAISGCARKAVYSMRQVPETDPLNSRQRINFHIGHLWHSQMQAAIAASPDVEHVYTEVKVLIPGLRVTGAADQLVIFKDESAELQEYKSIADYGFRKLTGPKDDHLEQIKPYMFGLREFGGISDDGEAIDPLHDRLASVRFTYINKATGETQEFVGDWDPAWETELRDRITVLDSYMADPLSLPPRLPMNGKKKSYMCEWAWGKCPYFTRCWNTDVTEAAPDPDCY